MLTPAVIGKDGRTTAIIKSLENSPRVGKGNVRVLSEWKDVPSFEEAAEAVMANARTHRPDFVVIGPEEPLAFGIVNRLQNELGIPCVGPTRDLAQLESSKAFTRELVSEFDIAGNPEYRVFRSLDGVEDYIRALDSKTGYVVKPDGLTGGKGVKVSDAHLFSIEEGLAYCRDLFASTSGPVVIEEKLDGEEFSLMSFCDGEHVRDMIPVQDHKRVGIGDTGPNTGGMGSYSCEDHLLPFLKRERLKDASDINKAVAQALYKKTGERYKGILYGGFMITGKGLRLLEYNARFGDPETMNVLAALETDLADIFEAIIKGTLDTVPVRFKNLATVCKYIVPNRYPEDPVKNEPIDMSAVPKSESLYRFDAAVKEVNGELILTGSRAVAFVGLGANLAEAEQIAEEAAKAVKGPVFHRPDIGTAELVGRRVEHVLALTHSH
jgi:phosphoribosylamine--glycine ligase